MRLRMIGFMLGAVLACPQAVLAQDDEASIVFSELLARGRDDGEPPGEWIELVNRSNQTVDLSTYRITHGDAEHVIAELTLEPKAFGIVRPSFRLRGAGGDLALLSPEGGELASVRYPPQHTGVSYGISQSGEAAFCDVPTPGSANGVGFRGVCAEPEVNLERGFYDRPIQVRLFSEEPETRIHYTLDGSMPSRDHGTLCKAEIPISKTGVLRAIVLRDGYLPSQVVTHTYIYLDQVISQPAHPPGFPTQWGRTRMRQAIPGDYAMDPRVTRTTLAGYGVRDALIDLPSISVVTTVENLFDQETGIYSHPEKRGPEWERAMSMEWIDPAEGEGFQVNAGIRMQGHSSRRPERMQKHSFRVDFQSQYGVKRLRFPVFPDSPVREFNKLVLRTPSTDSWALTGWVEDRYRPNDSQYIRDVWMKESLRAMGHPSGRSRFVHLYLNGLYWGIYILAERLDEDFFADHLGGLPEDWDVIRDFSELMSGDMRAWEQLVRDSQSAYAPETFEKLQGERSTLDLRNFADYMLLHFLADAEDWPHHNFYAAGHRGGDQPFRFLVWDQEIVLDNHAMNRMTVTAPGPGQIFHGLMRQPGFRHLFADRVYAHLAPGGAMSLKACQDRYEAISKIIDRAIVAESARWGDTAALTPYGFPVPLPDDASDREDPFYPAPADPKAPYMTRESSWLVEREQVLHHYLPGLFDLSQRHAVVNKLRANRLYPSIDPPEIATHANKILDGEATITLRHANPKGEIYYTLDGSDPRTTALQGEALGLVLELAEKRAIIPTHDRWDSGRVTWRDLGFDDLQWPIGKRGAGYELSPTGSFGMHIDPRLDVSLAVSPRANESIYLRASFQVSDPTILEGLILRIKYDDGYVAYINGREVARANVTNSKPDWRAAASDSRQDTAAMAFEMVDVSASIRFLRVGENVLAIHALNDGPSSSDFLIHPVLEGVKRRNPGVVTEEKGNRYTKPFILTEAATVQAAVKLGNEWSALTAAPFCERAAAASGNVRISEIMYHPREITDAEFVEIQNVSGHRAVDLTSVRLEGGIEFEFPDGTTVLPGDCVLAVKDEAAFRSRYGSGPLVAGVFKKSLANGKDSVSLRVANGPVIEKVAYEDTSPWPLDADGEGRSLERQGFEDATQATSWRASRSLGGSPGLAEVVSLDGR